MPLIRRRKLNALRLVKAWVESRGAGSEGWNRVYMSAPGKKFGRVRLSTNFPSKQIWRRMQTWNDDEFLLSFKFYGVQTLRKGFHELLLMVFLDIRRRDV